MSHKAPNHHFSYQKDRPISGTEARFTNLFRRLSSTKTKGERKQVRAAAMSQPASSQTQTTERVGGHPDNIPNRVESTEAEIPHVDTVHFGIFHDNIRDQVQKLRTGLSSVDGAIAELTKTFNTYGKIVSTVGERYGTDQVLEKEIYDLKVANNQIWGNIQRDRDSHESEILELKRKYEEQLHALQAQAIAGEQERRKYEEMQRNLQIQHNKEKQKIDKEFLQKKAQLESDKAEEIASLKKGKNDLENLKSRLEKDLRQRTAELDEEKETRATMQSKARTDIKKLEKTIADIKAKYQLDQQPLQFYVDRYEALVTRVDTIVIEYFTDLPDKAIDDPVGTSERLKKKTKCWAKVPIANSECSKFLRLATATHIIFDAICGSVWQPFFSTFLWKQKRGESILPRILPNMYLLLSAYGVDFQQNWKVSTLKILDQLDDTVHSGEVIDDLIDQEVIAMLQPLLDDTQLDPLKDALRNVLTDALELGKVAERDQSPVYYDTNPSMSGNDGWREYLSEDYDTDDTVSLSSPTTSTITDIQPDSLFLSPKISRQVGRAAAAQTAKVTNSATAAGRAELEVIVPGVALFPNTGIFQDGASDWQTIRNAGREAAKHINNGKGGRRQSMSMSVSSGLGIVPSPLEPSKMWSRNGTGDFD